MTIRLEPHATTLRRAATLMRTRAAAATQGDWLPTPHGVSAPTDDLPLRAVGGVRSLAVTRRLLDAEHIAALGPLVAVAVADVLDAHADLIDAGTVGDSSPAGDRAYVALVILARTYLGEGP